MSVNYYTDLLFYDRETGTGEFTTTNGNGGIQGISAYTNWRTTWDLIIPGDFGSNGYTDLLFYDRETGTGEFTLTDGSGGIQGISAYTNWRTTWD